MACQEGYTGYEVSRHRSGRLWPVRERDTGDLVCVTAYKKGAREVTRRLDAAASCGASDGRRQAGMWVEESFPLEAVVVTKAAEAALIDAGLSCSAQAVLARHVSGDWGDVTERQARKNDAQAAQSGTVSSVYRLRRHKIVRVVTNITRGTTCVMAIGEEGYHGHDHADAPH